MSQPRWLLWVVLLIMAGVLGWAGSASAQSRAFIHRDKAEKTPEDVKPPGKVTPGPKGAGDFGWGQTQKPPQGSASQGLKTEKPLGHAGPSQTRAASPNEPKAPKAPQEPSTPKTPKSPQDLQLGKPAQGGIGQDFAGSSQQTPPSPSWVQEEGQKLEAGYGQAVVGEAAEDQEAREAKTVKGVKEAKEEVEEGSGDEDEEKAPVRPRRR